jgi:hypothetical protein
MFRDMPSSRSALRFDRFRNSLLALFNLLDFQVLYACIPCICRVTCFYSGGMCRSEQDMFFLIDTVRYWSKLLKQALAPASSHVASLEITYSSSYHTVFSIYPHCHTSHITSASA